MDFRSVPVDCIPEVVKQKLEDGSFENEFSVSGHSIL